MSELSYFDFNGEIIEIADKSVRESITELQKTLQETQEETNKTIEDLQETLNEKQEQTGQGLETHVSTTASETASGHVKLSSSVNESSDVSGGTAATPLAVKTVNDKAEEAQAIAKGRNQALAYKTYQDMIAALLLMDNTELRRGQNIYIGTVGVPDLWVYGVEDTVSEYSYVDDETLVNELEESTYVQIGYYSVAQLEGQSVDLSVIEELQNIALTTTDDGEGNVTMSVGTIKDGNEVAY